MPSKAYSQQQREEIRVCLLQTALTLYSAHGIKNVRLMDILQIVGISKPFFYTFYESLQEFVVRVLDFQWQQVGEVIDRIELQPDWGWKQKARNFLQRLVHYREQGLLVMTQEEQVWVRERVGEERYHKFMQRQSDFFAALLRWWGIPEDQCAPQVFGNIVLSMIIVHSSTKKALPFLYQGIEEQVAQTQIESILCYLETLR